MRTGATLRVVALGLATLGCTTPHLATRVGGAAIAHESIAWRAWSADALTEARESGRPILLSVQTEWCHFCHVMNEVTYRDPDVMQAMRAFVAIRADADAQPDLATRFQRYGWPATIVLTPDGRTVAALRGYRPPDRFLHVLRDALDAYRGGRVVATPEEEPVEDLDALRRALIAQLDATYDEAGSGWGHRQRYPLAEPVEHAFFRAAQRGETIWRQRANDTLQRYATLIDPVWGGMYQYSVNGRWTEPHFEKIAAVQAGAIRAFALAYRMTGEARWRTEADRVYRYLQSFLRAPSGAFYASQDADLRGSETISGADFYRLGDEARRALGTPRIDTHVYASVNGMLIEALCALAVSTGRQAPLRDAVRAAERIVVSHRTPAGLFRHDAAGDDPQRYLADQAHMLAAFLSLYQATGEPRWRTQAVALIDAVRGALRAPSGGFYDATLGPETPQLFADRGLPVDDNARFARGLMDAARLCDVPGYRDEAVAALRAIGRRDALAARGRMVGLPLLALEEARAGHLLLSVVGPEEPRTRALHQAALELADPTRLVELGRPGESRYPYPGEPAIFICSETACSMPVVDPSRLAASVRAFR